MEWDNGRMIPPRARRGLVWASFVHFRNPGLRIAIFALTTAAVLLGVVLFLQPTHTQVAPVPNRPGQSPDFPRIATIYSKTDINTEPGKRAISRYNLYIT